jgi:hypothetical protein
MSLHARRGGASPVASVDVSEPVPVSGAEPQSPGRIRSLFGLIGALLGLLAGAGSWAIGMVQTIAEYWGS